MEVQKHKLPQLWQEQQIKVISFLKSFELLDVGRLTGSDVKCQMIYIIIIIYLTFNLYANKIHSERQHSKLSNNQGQNFSRILYRISTSNDVEVCI